MKPKDRRVRRTRASLRRALISLMAERPYASIVVKQILDRANVGRSTFYMHFSNKEDLLVDGLEGLAESLRTAQSVGAAAQVRKHDKVIAFSLAMFRHAYEHRDVYRSLVAGRAWDIVGPRIQYTLVELMREEARPLFRKKSPGELPFELFTCFLGSTFMAVLAWWLNQKKPISPEEMDSLFRGLVTPVLAAHLA